MSRVARTQGTGGESNFDTVLASRLVKHSSMRVVRNLNRARIEPTYENIRTIAGTSRRLPVVRIRDEDVARATDGH